MYLLFDIGASNTKIAFSRDGWTFEEPRKVATPQSFTEGITLIAGLAKELGRGTTPRVAAGGVSGPVSPDRLKLLRSPNLPDWIGKPLSYELEKALGGAHVLIENDSALVGLGEAQAGAGKGKGIVAYLTISTGVGGVRIVDGKIDRAAIGFEPGHQVIDLSGKACPECTVSGAGPDVVGHLEEYISGTAVKRRYNMDPSRIMNEEAWDEIARYLAYGLNNTILHWSPDIVVLGGSMVIRDVGIKIERVQAHLQEIMTIFPVLPEIKMAELGDYGGLHGALAFIRQFGK
jgi:glucokinase